MLDLLQGPPCGLVLLLLYISWRTAGAGGTCDTWALQACFAGSNGEREELAEPGLAGHSCRGLVRQLECLQETACLDATILKDCHTKGGYWKSMCER